MEAITVGIQISPHAILDEGIDHALDLLQDAAGVNALMLNTHGYYGAANGWRKPGLLATDHGVELHETTDGSLERQWVRHDPARFVGIGVGHRPLEDDDRWPGRDVFAEILEAAKARGMRVYGRYLEGWEDARTRHIPGWADLRMVDPWGEPLRAPCFANPRFLAWWRATVQDVAGYPIDGFFHGFERGATLSDVVFGKQRPYCFCEHCLRRADAAGVDADRAREGLVRLHDLSQQIRSGAEPPHRGWIIAMWSILAEYPEAIAWDKLEWQGRSEVERTAADVMHGAGSGAGFGTLTHPGADWFKGAREANDGVPEQVDFFVLRLYTDVSGPRLVNMVRGRGDNILQDLSERGQAELRWAGFGMGGVAMPDLETLDREGLPLEFVTRNTAHWAAKLRPGVPLYIGMGLDIPKPNLERMPARPDFVEACVGEALANGAKGFILCREYEEISAATMRSFRDALRRAT